MGKLARCSHKDRGIPDVDALTRSGGTLPVEIAAGPMSRSEAWAREVELIALHKRVCDDGTLFNRSRGGRGGGSGVKHTTAAHAKRAATCTANKRRRRHDRAARAAATRATWALRDPAEPSRLLENQPHDCTGGDYRQLNYVATPQRILGTPGAAPILSPIGRRGS